MENRNFEYIQCETWRRFFVCIIDYVIMSVILAIPIFLYLHFGGVKVPEPIQDLINSGASQAELMEYLEGHQAVLSELTNSLLMFLVFTLVITVVVYAVYLIIIPSIFKDFQTIGRKLLKIKIVKTNGDPMRPADYLLREFVGNYLINLISYCCVGLPFIINIVLIFTKGRIIADYISDCYFVTTTDAHYYEDDNDEIGGYTDNTYNEPNGNGSDNLNIYGNPYGHSNQDDNHE